MKNIVPILCFVGLFAASLASADAQQLIITEVDPFGSSGSSGYSGDWFELTNYGSTPYTIAGDLVVDSHTGTASDFTPLMGVTSIGAGQSVVFLDASTNGITPAAISAQESAFDTAWFGTTTTPSYLTFGYYDNSGIGLSQSGDQVNILSSTDSEITGVAFGSDTPANGVYSTFDNSVAKVTSTAQLIATSSSVGVDDAFTSKSGVEIGSPGEVSNAPEPGTWALLGMTGLLFLAWRRRGALLGL